MTQPLKILFAGSEAAPFVKTGGLGDVLGALPGAMCELGHDCRVVLPFFSAIDIRSHPCELVLDDVFVTLPAGTRRMSIWEIRRADGARVYLIKDDALFARHGIYDEAGREYPDNALRFAYFCMAIFWLAKGIGWRPDVFHCHDWQAALLPTYLNNLAGLREDPFFHDCRTLLTIHNLAYQGVCPTRFVPMIGLRWEMLNEMEMEFFGRLNLLKGGLVYSDALSTVSRRYAHEIQTAALGCGLEGVLRHRSSQLHGIMNGIDMRVWDPERDDMLPARYSAASPGGKGVCKAALQREFGLPVDPSRPVVAIVARIVEQKGFDLIAQIMPQLVEMGFQFVMLGRGMEKYERYFQVQALDFPEQVAVRIDYSEPMAHLIIAGSDMYFMPSRFEPCGLNQLYAMRYGSVPIVHRTGGLADSVIPFGDEALERGESTGFVFDQYHSEAFLEAVELALKIYRKRPASWRRLMQNGMKSDFSWHTSALEYERIMRGLTAGRIGGVAAA